MSVCHYKEFIDLLIHVAVAFTDIFKENEVCMNEIVHSSHHKSLLLHSHKI